MLADYNAETRDRIRAKSTLLANGCWQFNGYITEKGYGGSSYQGRTTPAHVVAYLAFVGPVPEGMTLDHVCRNRACVNPDHLEVVTGRENTMRGNGPTAVNARRTHCKYGHLLSGDNLVVRPKTGYRNCRICISETSRRYWQRKKARAAS